MNHPSCDSASQVLCSLPDWATPPLTFSSFTPRLNLRLPRPCFASLELCSTLLWWELCWRWWALLGGDPGQWEVHRGFSQVSGKVTEKCFGWWGQVGLAGMLLIIEKYKKLGEHISSLRPPLGSYIHVFSGGRKKFTVCNLERELCFPIHFLEVTSVQ